VCSYLAGGTEPWASRSLVGRESLKSGLLVFFLFPAYSGFILQRVVVTYRNWGTVEWVQEVKKCTGFEKVVSWWNQPSFKCPRASIRLLRQSTHTPLEMTSCPGSTKTWTKAESVLQGDPRDIATNRTSGILLTASRSIDRLQHQKQNALLCTVPYPDSPWLMSANVPNTPPRRRGKSVSGFVQFQGD
jgi:hypothetical protein